MAARAFYNDKDPHAAQWLRNLIAAGELSDGEVDERSIVDLSGGFGQRSADADECHFFAGIGVWARAVRDAEVNTGRRLPRPLWTGSAPCQPLSVAGQRQGDVDERHLWPAFYRLIAERHPATILGEQVAGKDGREWMAAVRHDLEALGYAVGVACLPAAGLGAPHLRYRLFFVAYADCGQRKQSAGRRPRPSEAAGGRPYGEPPGRGDAGGLADAQGDARRQWRGEPGDGPAGGAAQGMDELARRDGLCGAGWPSPDDGFWSDADWLFCRDGKWRPVEPGSFPLVDGSAFKLGSGGPQEGQFAGMSRTGMLRGYGNAIVLAVATAFVEAAMEALPCT